MLRRGVGHGGVPRAYRSPAVAEPSSPGSPPHRTLTGAGAGRPGHLGSGPRATGESSNSASQDASSRAESRRATQADSNTTVSPEVTRKPRRGGRPFGRADGPTSAAIGTSAWQASMETRADPAGTRAVTTRPDTPTGAG